MRLKLLEILACPRCGSKLTVADTRDWHRDVIISGTLGCKACNTTYPVSDGVPRLLCEDFSKSPTKIGYEYQWRARLSGAYEAPNKCYGLPIPEFVNWFAGTYLHKHGQSAEQPSWILDAGCGSGEKAAELARRYPQTEVVALDLSDTVALLKRRYRDITNLHFVQGNVRTPPFTPRAFQWVISIGVLHHTPNTLAAFESVASLVEPGGSLLVWLYPSACEDLLWAAFYLQRDIHFLGLGRYLPADMLLIACRFYVISLLFPMRLYSSWIRTTHSQKYPYYPRRMSWSDFYKAAVFMSFDNLMPEYQHRHSRQEVSGWYRALGFQEINDRFPGFFCGTLGSNSETDPWGFASDRQARFASP